MILSFFMDASLMRSTTFFNSESLPFFSLAFFSFKAAASAAVGLDLGFSTVSDRHSLTSSGFNRAPMSGPPRGIVVAVRRLLVAEAMLECSSRARCGCTSRQGSAVASIRMSAAPSTPPAIRSVDA